MSSIDDILMSMGAKPTAPAPSAPEAEAPPSAGSGSEVPPLDEAHRVAGAALDYRFRSATLRLDAADASALCADCTAVFALNCSNWLAATAEPRCALERLARAVFERHTAGVAFDPRASGAEWWAQVRGGGHRHEGIEFHWDVDEHFCDRSDTGGVHVHPHLSTVTYLADVGAPTLVLDARPPASSAPSAVAEAHGAVESGGISWPRLAKHIVFDGSLLHGAVPPAGRGAQPGERRVTFLVNVWLGHRPFAVEPLPASLAASMRSAWASPPHGAFAADLAPPPRLRVAAERGDGAAAAAGFATLHVAFGRHAKCHALRALLPPRPPREAGDTYRLSFAPGTAEVGANDAAGPKLKPSVSAPPAAAGEERGGGRRKKKKKKRRDLREGAEAEAAGGERRQRRE